MAQKILLRRGPVGNLSAATTSKGELLFATGAIGDLSGPFITMTGTAGTGTSTVLGKIYEGAAAPVVNSTLTGLPFYSTNDQALYRLNHAGNEKLDLSGNLEGTQISDIEASGSFSGSYIGNGSGLTNLSLASLVAPGNDTEILYNNGGGIAATSNLKVTATTLNAAALNITTTGNVSASNLLLSGNANIDGNIVLGGNINIGNADTDFVNFGAEVTSNIVPDVDSTYDLGTNAKRWLNIYVDNVSGSTADFSGGVSTLGYVTAGGALDVTGAGTIRNGLVVTGSGEFTSTVTATTGISSSGWIHADGALDVDGASTLTGNVSVGGTLGVASDLAVNTNKFTVASSTGNTAIAGTLGVTSDLAVNTNKFTVAAATGNTAIAGTLGVTSDFAVNSNTFTVAASSGNTAVAGTLTVAGQTDLNGNVNIGNAATDTVTVTADIDSNLIPFATNTYDLGSSSDKWRFGYFVSASIESLTISGIDPTAQDLDDVMNNGASTDNDFSLTKNGDQQITHQGATGNLLISSNNGNVKIENTVFNGDNVTIPGDLTVSGTTTTINSTEVNIGDNIITLNAAGTVADGGVQVIDTTGTAHTGSLLWNANNDYWYAGISGSTHYRVATFTNASPVSNAIPVIDANKRLVASSVTDDGTTVAIDANVQVTGSLVSTLGATVNGLTDSSSTAAIRFTHINASKQITYTTPAATGDILQWDGAAMVASNVIDGGTF